MKWFKRIFLFILILFLYFLPTFIFKADQEFYNGLNGPKLPPIVFMIVWTVLYVILSFFITYHITNKHRYIKKDFRRVMIFLIINYIVNFLFPFFFFVKQSLFLGYIFTLLNLLTIILVAIESLLLKKKFTLLLLPHIIWGIIASIFSILLYLNN